MTTQEIRSPMAATVVEIAVAAGQAVRTGELLAVVDAMKMEHELRAPHDARVMAVLAKPGELLAEGDGLLRLGPVEHHAVAAPVAAPSAADAAIRPELQEFLDRAALLRDDARPEAVARRHAAGQRTARENVADLCDEGSFVEYGAFAHAAQTKRRPVDELIRQTPADGMVTGIGRVGGLRCAVLAYDATVLAGTQGLRNHQKTDRLLGLAHEHKMPVVLFAEGGGGRPGDTDMPIVAGLHVATFARFAGLSGRVPLLGIAAGRCFAGNAALLGCCDLIVATRGSNIGMGGPAMIEGGGLGRYAPEDIGPAGVHSANGAIDVLVDDEAAAVSVVKKLLAMLAGEIVHGEAPDPSALCSVLPEQRTRSHDMRRVIEGLVDRGSAIELRSGFGLAIHTVLARLGGRPVGILSSNPLHLGGAIDADAADKAARFMRLCDAHGIALVSLIDTPGFMVGPEVEARAQVRHVSRMFVAAAHLRVPFLAVVLRKAYGLGAMAMAAGGFHAPLATAAWPTGEFGAMGLEGAVRLGFRKELEALPDGEPREARFRELLARQVADGRALNMAATLEIDTVIDPADTRGWLWHQLDGVVASERSVGGLDPW
ncbi:carboxyl transferase domain-containing protein [Piscinibacter sp.]|uniref:carboxyl transferase domain-containing protein n=1 Tax=Piscinibacter sp. TaxID=1903157 RepID=UPI003D1438D8